MVEKDAEKKVELPSQLGIQHANAIWCNKDSIVVVIESGS